MLFMIMMMMISLSLLSLIIIIIIIIMIIIIMIIIIIIDIIIISIIIIIIITMIIIIIIIIMIIIMVITLRISSISSIIIIIVVVFDILYPQTVSKDWINTNETRSIGMKIFILHVSLQNIETKFCSILNAFAIINTCYIYKVCREFQARWLVGGIVPKSKDERLRVEINMA